MKLCVSQLKKSFGRLLLVFVMLLVGVFTTNTFANAASIDSLDIIGNQITIVDNENSVLMCQFMTNDSVGSVVYNGYTLANLYNVDTWGVISQVFYLNNPTIGTHNISFSGSINWDYPHPTCYLLTGVNTDNLILSSNAVDIGNQITSISGNISPVNSGSLLLGFYTTAQDGSINVVNSTEIGSGFLYGSGSNIYFKSFYNISTSTVGNISLTSAWGGYNQKLKLFELNTNITPPVPSGVSIDKVQYSPVTGNVFLSGTCQTQGSGNQQMNIYAYESGTSTPNYLNAINNSYSGINGTFSNGLVSCINDEWSTVYNGKKLTGSMRLVIDDSFYGTTLASEDIEWQQVTGFIDFNYGTNSTIYVDTTDISGATTTLNFRYNICDDPNYSSSTSKIYLGEQSGTNFQYTYLDENSYYYSATTCSGTGSITFHTMSGYKESIRSFFAYANAYNVVYLKSGYFYIVLEYNESYLEENPYLTDEVCGDESNPLATTWCFLSTDIFKPIFKWSFEQVMTVFPFVLVSEINQSWEDSARGSLPSSLDFLNFPDEFGNLNIGLPDRLSGSNDVQFVVFGSDVFSSSPEIINFFRGIRNLSTYFLWALFAFAIYRFGKQIIENKI